MGEPCEICGASDHSADDALPPCMMGRDVDASFLADWSCLQIVALVDRLRDQVRRDNGVRTELNQLIDKLEGKLARSSDRSRAPEPATPTVVVWRWPGFALATAAIGWALAMTLVEVLR